MLTFKIVTFDTFSRFLIQLFDKISSLIFFLRIILSNFLEDSEKVLLLKFGLLSKVHLRYFLLSVSLVEKFLESQLITLFPTPIVQFFS
jgi:hypothetical protein